MELRVAAHLATVLGGVATATHLKLRSSPLEWQRLKRQSDDPGVKGANVKVHLEVRPMSWCERRWSLTGLQCTSCDERPNLSLTRSFIADAAAAAAPAVVNINTTGGFGLTSSAGSGFIIDKGGLLMTNAHVVQHAYNGEVTVTLWNGGKLRGHVHSMDKESDIALVQITGRPPEGGFAAAHIGTSSRLRVGDFVVALGSPLNLGRTVTAGIVSATARHASEIGSLSSKLDYIQTDAAVNHGNSGGPLVNLDGEVIGVCTLKAGNSDGIAFAVPIDTAWPVVKMLLKHKKVVRPFIGIKFQIDHTARAVIVADVKRGSPAEKAGLSVGDRIVSCDGHPVNRIHDIFNRTGVSPGQCMLMEIKTPNGDMRTVTIVTAPDVASAASG